MKRCKTCNFQLPYYDNLYCYDPPKINNCMFYNHPLSCNSCKPGYEKNENAIFDLMDENYKDLFY